MKKSFLKSKLFWLGVVLFLGNGLNALTAIVSPEFAGYISSALGILVIVFRAITGEVISFGGKVFGNNKNNS